MKRLPFVTLLLLLLMAGCAQPETLVMTVVPQEADEYSFRAVWQTLGDVDLKQLARDVGEALADSNAVISSLGIFGNPLESDEKAKANRDGWRLVFTTWDRTADRFLRVYRNPRTRRLARIALA